MSVCNDQSVERKGIVYISASHPHRPDASAFAGYWDRGVPPEVLEQGPGWATVEAAVAWGRERAPRVLVRLGKDESSIYSAGEIRLTQFADGSGPAYPEWRPTSGP